MKNTNIYNWVFIKNPFTNKYYAAKREDFHLLYNDSNSPKVLKSSSMSTLEEIISRTDGDMKEINKLIRKSK